MKCRHGGMILRTISVAITLLTWGIPAHAQSARKLCFDPKQWDGRYPAEQTAGAARFLDLPCVRAPLKALLPAPEFRRLFETLTVDAPIRVSGRYLIVARCMAHACPSDHAMVILDTEDQDFVVGFYRRPASGSLTRWYASGKDALELPAGILQEFLRKHTPAQ